MQGKQPLKARNGHDAAETATNLQFNACRIRLNSNRYFHKILATRPLTPYRSPDSPGISIANVGDANKLY